jgi:PAS domain S-box-containing protein
MSPNLASTSPPDARKTKKELLSELQELRAQFAVLKGCGAEEGDSEVSRDSQALLRAIIEGIPDPIFIKDRQSRIIMANPATLRVIGKSLEEVIGKDDRSHYADPAVGEALMANDRRIMESGKPETVEEVGLTPDGYRTFISTKTPYRNSKGEVIGIMGVSRDITERKRAEEMLHESEKRFDYALRAAQEGIWDWNMETDEVYYSPRYKEMLGYSEDEIEPHASAWVRLMHPDDRERALKVVEAVKYGERGYEMEFRMLHKDGHYVDILSRGFPIRREAGGPVTRIVGTHMDVTERNRVAKELHKARDELEARVRERTAELNAQIVERKQAEEALRDRQAHLNSIFRVAPTGIGVVKDRVITEVNDQLCEMTDYSREELLGQSARSLYPTDEDYEYVGREKYEQISRMGTGSVETRWLRKDGRVIDILLSSTPLDRDNLAAGVTFTALDITERKRAEEKVAYVASFPELNPNPVIEVDYTGNITYSNPSADRMYPDLRASGYTHALLKDITFRRDAGSKAGSILVRDVEVNGRFYQQSIIDTPERNVMRIYCIDITERKQAEEALKESEERFNAFMNNSPAIAWMKDEQGRHVYLSKTYEDRFGVKLEDWRCKTDFDLWPREIAEQFWKNDRKVLDTGQTMMVEEKTQNPDDSFTYWMNYKFPFQDASGHRYTGGIGVDITDSKRAEEALHESEERFRQLADNSPIPMAINDKDDNIIYLNKKFIDTFGYTMEDILHLKYWWHLAYPDPAYREDAIRRWEKGVEDAVRESKEIGPLDYTVTCKDGSIRFTEISGARVGDNELVLLQDVTERRRAEEDLNEAKQHAELYLDLMGHDISNMHQIILGQLQLAEEIMSEEGKLESGDKEFIDTSINNLLRTAKLIENVKNLRMLRTGEFSVEPVNLDEILNDAVAAYSSVPNKHIIIDYTPARGHVVLVNPVIKEVFNNLIDNAVKHSGDPVKIGIVVSHVERNGRAYHRVAIEDNGPGISDEKKNEVFHRLKRGHTKARGTGLGLYLVKTLAESFGGIVELEDRVSGDYSQGSRFSVYLPAVEG